MNSLAHPCSATQTARAFVRDYVVTMRPYLLFVSGITGIAGMSFGDSGDPVRTLSIFAACFLSYGFGQALTDCFQTDTDSISSPYRPLTRGVISRRATLAVSLAGLACCVGILGFWNPANLLAGVLAGIGLATYTWFKRRWWGGPAYNAWIVSVLFLMGALAAGYRFDSGIAIFGFTAAGTFFGYANFVLTGYFKDIGADRATGYVTLPVRYGRRASAIVSDVIAAGLALSIAGILVYSMPQEPAGTPAVAGLAGQVWRVGRVGQVGIEALLFFAAALIAIFAGQWNLHRVRFDETAHRSIIPVVHAYILTLAGAAASRKPDWFFPLIGFYVTFCVVLAHRPERQQI